MRLRYAIYDKSTMSLRTLVLCLAATATCAVALPAVAQGTGGYVKVEYPPSAAPGELQVGVTYILWVPEGVTRLRGVIVHQHGAGRNAAEHGATAAYDLHWQALARISGHRVGSPAHR